MWWFDDLGTIQDLDELTELRWELTVFGFYADTGSVWLGTEYVTMIAAEINYGDNRPFNNDLNPDEEILNAVIGDYTASEDVLTSGLEFFGGAR